MSGDRGRNPTIYRVTCAVASTQYSQLLATGTKMLKAQSVSSPNLFWLAYASGAVVSTPRWTVRSEYAIYEQDDLDLGKGTIFVASPVTGAVVEMIGWA